MYMYMYMYTEVTPAFLYNYTLVWYRALFWARGEIIGVCVYRAKVRASYSLDTVYREIHTYVYKSGKLASIIFFVTGISTCTVAIGIVD